MDPIPRSYSQLSDDSDDVAYSPRGCCSFCLPRWHRIDDRARHDYAASRRPHKWWGAGVGALMKAREWSEIVAGPKWKTFIRRFNRSSRHHGDGGSGNGRGFGYDPLSYALNFDGTPEREFGYADFSTRFVAAGPATAKARAGDVGGREELMLFAPPPAVTVAAAH